MKFLFMFLLVVLVSCGDATVDADKQPITTLKQPNCNEIEWVYDTIGLDELFFKGWIKEKIEQGQIPHTGTIIECDNITDKVRHLINYKDGKRDGVQKRWYDNGQLWIEMNYKDGKGNGLMRSWYENGQLLYKAYQKYGKLDGKEKWWYENGQLNAENNYKDGKIRGQAKVWHENGKLHNVINYKVGENNGYAYKDGKVKWWYDNGQLSSETNYKDGLKVSAKCWDEDGNEIECSELKQRL